MVRTEILTANYYKHHHHNVGLLDCMYASTVYVADRCSKNKCNTSVWHEGCSEFNNLLNTSKQLISDLSLSLSLSVDDLHTKASRKQHIP
jgi:hypothetical protein